VILIDAKSILKHSHNLSTNAKLVTCNVLIEDHDWSFVLLAANYTPGGKPKTVGNVSQQKKIKIKKKKRVLCDTVEK
jgi:hypothetical protein